MCVYVCVCVCIYIYLYIYIYMYIHTHIHIREQVQTIPDGWNSGRAYYFSHVQTYDIDPEDCADVSEHGSLSHTLYVYVYIYIYIYI